MTAFWDASAVVPLCVPGQGGPVFRRLLAQHPLVVWWGTLVESASAVARLRREGAITARQAEAARMRLDLLRRSWREMQPVAEVRDLAIALSGRADLRAGDALQLAAALVWCGHKPARRIFICCDIRLSAEARQAGFQVVQA